MMMPQVDMNQGKLTASLLGSWPTANPGEPVLAEYIWIGGMPENFFSCMDLRSKTKTLPKAPTSIADLPVWNYDGSSTNQAPGSDSEVLLKPVAMFTDPFRGAPHLLVMAECVLPETM